MIYCQSVCGHGGIGRRARFRFKWETVQVQVLLPVLFTRVSEVFITSEILIFLSFFLYERIPQCRLTRI